VAIPSLHLVDPQAYPLPTPSLAKNWLWPMVTELQQSRDEVLKTSRYKIWWGAKWQFAQMFRSNSDKWSACHIFGIPINMADMSTVRSLFGGQDRSRTDRQANRTFFTINCKITPSQYTSHSMSAINF
jgi:hypothetical protein